MSTESREAHKPVGFHWPKPSRSSWRLAGLIFLTLFLHAAAFFLFVAAAPSTNSTPRTALPIQLLTSVNPEQLKVAIGAEREALIEQDSLFRWIETEDPALVARIPSVQSPETVDVPYRSSYSTMRTAPLDLPPEPPTVLFPPARDAMSLIQSGLRLRTVAQPSPAPQPTVVRFSPDLEARLKQKPSFQPKARSQQLVQGSQFLIGVTAEGEVRFVFPQKTESASVPELEDEASAFLRSLAFEPAQGAITWGSAKVQWGDDISTNP